MPQLIDQLQPGEELVITRADKPIARLVAEPKGVPIYGRGKDKMSLDPNDKSHLSDFPHLMPQPQFGSCEGMLTIHEEDDEHLKDFSEYMP